MPVKRVFVDGSAGTTGLNIIERLSGRNDIELLALPEELRKDEASRKQMINEADIVFLCLPDQAAKEAASWLENPSTRVIDTSTAHRVHPDWTYGFPELTGQRNAIADARLVANPGCHASGFIALVRPLTENCLIAKDLPLSCFSLTGYSGGGKKMIAEYEAAGRSPLLDAPRMYGLNQSHKHLPEMKHVCGHAVEPVFCPIVAPYYAGMEVTVRCLEARPARPLLKLPPATRRITEAASSGTRPRTAKAASCPPAPWQVRTRCMSASAATTSASCWSPVSTIWAKAPAAPRSRT